MSDAAVSATAATGGMTVQLPGPSSLPTPPARNPIFYPPDPPAPGTAIDRVTPLEAPGWDAPADLQPHVGEIFYTALATQLAEQELSGSQRKAVDRYRTARQEAVTTLRARLATTPAPSPSAPPDFTAKLSALEDEAEKIRASLFDEEFAWGLRRDWGVGPNGTRQSSPQRLAREYAVLRAAVSDFDGLSLAQRQLLREISAPRSAALRPPAELGATRAAPGAVVFFLPAGAQIRLPAPLGAGLADDFNAFFAAKHALQRELVAAVLVNDGESRSTRRKQLSALATRQAPLFTALETQAEALRVQLAALPAADSSPALPADVVQLSREFHNIRSALREKLRKTLLAARTALGSYVPGSEQLYWATNFSPGALVDTNTNRPANLAGYLTQTREQETRPVERRTKLTQITARWNEETAPQQKTLEDKRRAALFAAARALDPRLNPAEPIPAELAARAADALRAEDLRTRLPLYADYETATRRPGLTPTERRLLFNAALVDLALPLPTGIRRPVSHYESP